MADQCQVCENYLKEAKDDIAVRSFTKIVLGKQGCVSDDDAFMPSVSTVKILFF